MSRAQTREELIQVGTEIIALHGFGPTGINAVLSTAGVPKGSFYYYFSSKEDFGLAIIDAAAADYAARIDSFLSDANYPPLERIRNYMTAGMAQLGAGQCKRGCLLGSLGQELSSHNETFRARLDAVFKNWKQRFSRCLDEARSVGDLAADSNTGPLAEFLLSGWQGAILRAKMSQSTAPLQAFIDTVFGQVLKRPN